MWEIIVLHSYILDELVPWRRGSRRRTSRMCACAQVLKKCARTETHRVARDLFWGRSNSEPAAVSFDPVTRSAWVARNLTREGRGWSFSSPCRMESIPASPTSPTSRPYRRCPPPFAAHLLVRADGRSADQPAVGELQEVEEIKESRGSARATHHHGVPANSSGQQPRPTLSVLSWTDRRRHHRHTTFGKVSSLADWPDLDDIPVKNPRKELYIIGKYVESSLLAAPYRQIETNESAPRTRRARWKRMNNETKDDQSVSPDPGAIAFDIYSLVNQRLSLYWIHIGFTLRCGRCRRVREWIWTALWESPK